MKSISRLLVLATLGIVLAPDQKASGGPVKIFDTTQLEEDESWVVEHVGTNNRVEGCRFRKENGVEAEAACDIINKLAKKSKTALDAIIGKEEDKGRKRVLQSVREILHGSVEDNPVVEEQKHKDKMKTREFYGSAARNSFKVRGNITDKEAMILEAIETCMKEGKPAFGYVVAELIEESVNVVSGAISVLLSKDIVSSARVKDTNSTPNKIRRAFAVTFPDWKTLVGKDKADRKAANEARQAESKAKAEAAAQAKEEAKKKAAAEANEKNKEELAGAV